MHWAFGYLGKHAAQKVLGAVPYGFLVQELVKRASGRARRFTSAGFIREGLESKINQFNAAGIEPPKTVVEQGTGWHGFDLVLFYLAGAQRILTYDTNPWLRTDLLRRNVEVLANAADIVKRWRGTVPGDVDERAARLGASLDAPRDLLLKRLGATVRVGRSMDRSEIGSASADLFYSNSVLQFVTPRDLTALVREAHRFLKPSGRCFHVVACSDSHANHDRRVPPLAYLAWPEPVWKLLTSRYLNYQNRWRMPHFVALFENQGFRVRALNPVVRPDDIAYVKRHFARTARFGDLPPEDIGARQFLLTGSLS